MRWSVPSRADEPSDYVVARMVAADVKPTA